MAAMESEAVLPDPKNLLLVLDEGHHLPDVALENAIDTAQALIDGNSTDTKAMQDAVSGT